MYIEGFLLTKLVGAFNYFASSIVLVFGMIAANVKPIIGQLDWIVIIPIFIWFLVLISETSIEFSLASGVISSMANHGKSPSKSHWPMLFLLKDARWLRRFLNGVPHFVWCDWCNLYKTPMFIIYNCLYIYIYTRNAWVLPRRCSVEVSHSQTNDVANYRNSYGENNKGTRDY